VPPNDYILNIEDNSDKSVRHKFCHSRPSTGYLSDGIITTSEKNSFIHTHFAAHPIPNYSISNILNFFTDILGIFQILE
jgi:hypothetical protein